ncbi:MAG TPA: ATP-binding protein [bacterium]|nr:ATP-binding protein [bacterium]
MSENLMARPEMRKLFEDYNVRESIRLAKIACWVCAVAMPSAFFLDMIDYPHLSRYFFEIRLACSFTALIVLGLIYTPWGARFHLLLTLLLAIVSQGFIAWMISASEGPNSPYYAILNLPLLIFCLLFPWTFLMTISLSAATMIFYVLACLIHGGITTGHIFFSNSVFLTYTVSFAILASYFTNQLRVREFTTRYELDQNRKQLAESNQKLIELDRMKSHFFANISHELRTPLTLLVAPIQSLRFQKGHLLDEESRDILETMENNAMRLLKLINDLLDLSKLESGRMEVNKEVVAVETFIKGLVQSIQNTAKDKQVSVISRVQDSIGMVMLDRNKMEKILLNLLFNALKFTPPGGQVEVSAEKARNQLVLIVSDTGMGIAKKNLPFIFDRFWQADSSAQRKYQGTGIGLALVKELTEVQGGIVTAESEEGVGTRMTIRVPCEEAEGPEAPTGNIPSGPGKQLVIPDATVENAEWLTKLYRRAELFPTLTPVSETLRFDSYGNGKRRKLLIADDEPDMLKFLKTQLEKHYEVLEAVDGAQAVEKAKQFLPDLVLLDMMMPGKDGIQACRELKEWVPTQSIPVVLLTARADEGTKLSALNAGANDFLTKPFSTTELHVRVQNLVQSHQFQRELAREKTALESTLERLKETEGQLVQSEKMASLGRLSAGIIHEINNPLNYASTALHLLKSKKDKLPESEREKYGEIVSDIEEGMGRVQHIVSDLRTFSHPRTDSVDLIELDETITTALRFVNQELKGTVQIQLEVPQGQQVLGDRNKLIHVFVNLFQNSVDAIRAKNFIDEQPQLSVRSRTANGKVQIHVRDNGCGIAPENLDKVFDPFFTTKDVGQGMGLGLSLCYRILSEQGGKISVESEPGKYTDFLLELPVKN